MPRNRCPRSTLKSFRSRRRPAIRSRSRRAVEGRSRKRLGVAAGLTQFGVNLCTLKPGAASSQNHWHDHEDEFVYMLEGEAVLCEDGNETVLKAG